MKKPLLGRPNCMWKYRGKDFTAPEKDMFGFVYLITRKNARGNAPRFYVGKKFLWRKRGKGVCQSDWRNYWGSCNSLIKDIEQYGEKHFKREILWICGSKSELAYREAKEQFDRNALIDSRYYNKIIHCRIPWSEALSDTITNEDIKNV